ncbi:kinase-like domain-containing protein [Lobosporangium transversale]|uniref:Kinase-like domain-containing protein n=1 Tax=Lobosporangium transversale TaxID=64571 RepID=A0A1Y2G123_9FUNG|nr:kinase-like domain-containing protein [Lobosporangium transversale]ORY90604.1 kinase-like domain-containing protein [Lobosporangium transversale]|eukprot:XP_021875099.1 kinase-like domain-containing protein [Lobosporangium transversale]
MSLTTTRAPRSVRERGCSRSGGKRQTNWAEFYKNGPPQEVIVIEDDTPPPPSSSSASYSHYQRHQQVPGSGSSSNSNSSSNGYGGGGGGSTRSSYHRDNHHPPLPPQASHQQHDSSTSYPLRASPRSYAMPPPSSSLPHHVSHTSSDHNHSSNHQTGFEGSHDGHYHHPSILTAVAPSMLLEPSSRTSRRLNKRPPSAELVPLGSNGSYPHPSYQHYQPSQQHQQPLYLSLSGDHDPYYSGSSSYSSAYHYPPPSSPQRYHQSHHHYDHYSRPYQYSSSRYPHDYGDSSELTAPDTIPPPRKRRKSNSAVKYIAPPSHQSSTSQNGHGYSSGGGGYYHQQHEPVAAKVPPASSRDPPATSTPWDDKEGHYIVVPNEDLTPRYKIIRLLGQGTFGKVVECFDRETGKHCAIKIIRAVQKYREASKIEARVLDTLKQHDPQNRYQCLHLNECFDYRRHVCMVFDLLGQSIYDWLKDNAFCPFPPNQIQHFARQLFNSVAFLHRLRLIHTDLKPENILLANGAYRQAPYKKSASKTRRILLDPEIRLIDFGSATFQNEHHSTIVSTRHYRAPEIILGLGWSYPCDIWSIGCILVEFLTGEALFQTHDNLEHLAMMQAVLGPIPDKLIRASHKSSQKYFVHGRLDYPNDETKRNSRKYVKALKPLREYVIPSESGSNGNREEISDFSLDFVDLLSRLLTYDPAERITAAEALRHPFFNYIVDENGQILGMKKSSSSSSSYR